MSVPLAWLALTGLALQLRPMDEAETPSVVLQQAAPSLEYQVKAAYLLRFTQFVYWPAERFTAADQPLTIGVIGTDRFGPILDSAVAGRVAQGHPIVVRRVVPGEALNGIQLLFVGPLTGRERHEALRQAGEQGVLTVGETDDFLTQGGGISLLHVGETIRFTVNLKTAQRGGLRIDARALAVAYAVYDR